MQQHKETPVDQEWFEQLTQILDNHKDKNRSLTLVALDLTPKEREHEHAEFLRDREYCPDFRPRRTNIEDIESKEKDLIDLKERIEQEEENGVIKLTYRWKINTMIAFLRLLKASIKGDMGRFRRYSHFLYGAPDPDVQSFCLDKASDVIKESLQSDDPEMVSAAEKLREHLLNAQPSHREKHDAFVEIQPPSDQLIAETRKKVHELHADLLPEGLDPSEEEISPEQTAQYFQEALKSAGADDWKVIINPNRTGMIVKPSTQEIHIPAGKKQSMQRVLELIFHEIGAHVTRYLKGKESNLKLLSIGLDRYIKGEEGVGALFESMAKPESKPVKDFGKFGRHLAISLATGVNHDPYNFREVYETMEAYYYLDELRKGKEHEAAKEKAAKRTWITCQRVYKGTHSDKPGTCFTKDIVYREGEIGTWLLLNEKEPDSLSQLTLGKWDHTNARHWWILSQTGVLPEDQAKE